MPTTLDARALIKTATADLKTAVDIMLSKYCEEIFGFTESFTPLTNIAEKDCPTVEIGMYAVGYSLAGVAISISHTVLPISEFFNGSRNRIHKRPNIPKGYKPILRKLITLQGLMAAFGDDVERSCHTPLMHITSQLAVLLEHPYVCKNDLVRKELTHQLHQIEVMMEKLYEISHQFKNHPIMAINANLIPDGLIH